MNRLTSGTVSLIALLVVSGCNNDPTEDLRGGITKLQASPSTANVVLGKTKTVQVSALDDQGNLLETAFEVTDVGPGISVKRDSTFFPQFVNDTLLTVPPTAPTFQFIITGTEFTTSSFKVTAGGQEVTIPVTVTSDPTTTPLATVASTGPSASDPTVLTLPAPFQFGTDAGVTFDAGAAIVVSRSDDGRSITIFPPPGATNAGAVTGVVLDYIPTVPLTTTTDVALTISPTVPPQPGTDSPATAPTIAIPASGGTTAFYDGTGFASPVCGVSNDGVPCQLYKFTMPADGSFDVDLVWNNTTDLGVYILTADGTADTDQACDDLGNAEDGGEEACTITLTAGDYLLAVVNFGPFYTPPDPTPDWISLAITTP
jgi:Bacterial pre-peptidase C-terminal domain